MIPNHLSYPNNNHNTMMKRHSSSNGREKSPTIAVVDSIDPWSSVQQKKSPRAATNAGKGQSALLSTPPRLRRTKSLPADFSRYQQAQDSNAENQKNGKNNQRSLFWFRPDPQRPFSKSPAVSPPRKAGTSRGGRAGRRHRRHATAPDPFIPRELNLPTLHEEEPPVLSSFLARLDSSNYSDDEEEDDLDLRGLSFLEERDE